METEATAPKKRLTNRVNSSLLERLPAILEACRKSGVVTLKCGDLEVNFASPGAFLVESGVTAPFTLPNLDAPARQDSEPMKTEPLDQDLLEQMRRSQLMIDDPLAFEQEVIDGHIQQG